MNQARISLAKKAIHTLADREGVSADTIREAIWEAMLEAQKQATPTAGSLLSGMPQTESLPSPEALIAWAAHTARRRRDGDRSALFPGDIWHKQQECQKTSFHKVFWHKSKREE